MHASTYNSHSEFLLFVFIHACTSAPKASRKRRGKAIAHEDDEFDDLRFKSPFHQNFYNTNVPSKPIIPDTRFNLEEGQYPHIQQQIELRGWKRLNKPKKRISQAIVQEFYANARIDLDSEDDPRFHTFVRGVMVNFSMDRIQTVMKFEGPLNTEMSYRTRMIEGNQELDTMIRDFCVEGSVWSLEARNNPLYLKRSDLNPIARGWHGFIIHNIMPTTNQSEVTLNRAVLIHCIMSSQEVRGEKIIVDAMINIITKLHATKPPLAFPNIIPRLCEEMEVPYLASGPVEAVPKARPITTTVMENLRYPPVQPYFQQEQPANAANVPQGYGWGQLQEDTENLNKNLTYNSIITSWPNKLLMGFASKTWRQGKKICGWDNSNSTRM
ncbi:hypothetical protein PIB30_080113 [Stylosanthes scabra]|uniref:Putative plant transposon protein domain-containing protein n=1 Tax=Stylosanthes scabra TaxID=79078 RepID=A0ABU6XTW0_9FABA|nr:hypothetical protein [Stylosanthes scabra]